MHSSKFSCHRYVDLYSATLSLIFLSSSLSISVTIVQASDWQEIEDLVSGDISAADNLGVAVGVSGNLAIVGASADDDNGSDSGSAYLFEDLGGGTWLELVKFDASDGASDDSFGASVAIDGSTALIGANGDDSKAGSVYIFRDTTSWMQIDKIQAGDALANDRFGTSLALDGNTAIVGAPFGDTDSFTNVGSAYVFEESGSWGEVTELNAGDVASEAGTSSQFGFSVALDGDLALVGAPFGDSTTINDTGAAYLFEKDHLGNWTEIAKLEPSDGQLFDNFGASVSLDGGTAVIGAPFGDAPLLADVGAAYVFQDDGFGNWLEVDKINASDAGFLELDSFGVSVGIDSDIILVGSSFDSDDGFSSGSAFLFEENGSGSWVEKDKLKVSTAASGDQFGGSVHLDGDVAVIGGIGVNGAGAAFVFNPVVFQEADFDESGSVNEADLLIWENGYGMGTSASRSDGDADGDGDVDGIDLLIWQRQTGIPKFRAIVNQVPEPTATAIAAVGLLLVASVRFVRDA